MVLYNCPRCNYQSCHKTNIKSHFERKVVCKPTIGDISIDNCKKMLTIGEIKTETQRTVEKIDHICKYCNKHFDRSQRLDSHLNKCSEKENELTVSQEKIKNLEDQVKVLLSNQEKLEDQVKVLLSKQGNFLLEKQVGNVCHFIYIIQEREFAKSGEDIYKIGKTRGLRNRMGDYPKGSKIKFIIPCDDIDKTERELLILFDEQFVRMENIGREYFRGDLRGMIGLVIKNLN
jgi:hypothetical protein